MNDDLNEMSAKVESQQRSNHKERSGPMDDDIIKETGAETEGTDIAGTEDAAKIKEVTDALPDEDTLDELEELFKIFGDSTRIKILYALHIKEMCVMDISLALGMSQSAISHQLRVLRQTRLIRSRRDGKNIYYSLADEHVHTIISMGLEHIEE